ncbi:MAG: hypothetical protein QXR27_01920, partial [Archaeoglobaceae archaeon]
MTLAGTVKKTYNVAFTATKVSADQMAITFMGGPDVDYVESCSAKDKTWNKNDVGVTKTVTA